MERLFSYGTLQQTKVQQKTFGRLLQGAPDALLGFKLERVEITDPDVLATSAERFHPIVVRDDDVTHCVAGTVFEVTAAELATADAYEVDDYERMDAPLASGLNAWVYVKRA